MCFHRSVWYALNRKQKTDLVPEIERCNQVFIALTTLGPFSVRMAKVMHSQA